MELEVRVGFDFGKLAQEMPTLINRFLNESKNETAKVSKDFIKSGQVTPGILDKTQKRRIRRGNPPQPPLYETGELHDSIKPTKNGIEFKGYGAIHEYGIGRQRQRQFIKVSRAKDSLKKLISKMRKALSRRPPLVLKSGLG